MTSLPDEVEAWRAAERARLIAARLALPAGHRGTAAARVRRLLATEVAELRRATVGFYRPAAGEIDLRDLAQELVAGGGRAVLAVKRAAGGPLEFRPWRPEAASRPAIPDQPDDLPVPAWAGAPLVPDCLLVPLLGFDEAGYRLGQGGGSWERTLAALPRRPLALGIGYACQRLASVRPRSCERPLDAIVTEDGIRWHRRPVPGAHRPAVASAEEDPNVEPIECSSPPCFMHEL